MPNVKNEPNHPFFKKLAKTFRERLKEIGITKYALCRDNKFSRQTCQAILTGERSFSLAVLLEYLDAVDLELKIVRKKPKRNKNENCN